MFSVCKSRASRCFPEGGRLGVGGVLRRWFFRRFCGNVVDFHMGVVVGLVWYVHLSGKTRVAGKSWKITTQTSEGGLKLEVFGVYVILYPPICRWKVEVSSFGFPKSKNCNVILVVTGSLVKFHGCFNWMIPSHHITNVCFPKHPLEHACLGYQVLPVYLKKSSDVMKGMLYPRCIKVEVGLVRGTTGGICSRWPVES